MCGLGLQVSVGKKKMAGQLSQPFCAFTVCEVEAVKGSHASSSALGCIKGKSYGSAGHCA